MIDRKVVIRLAREAGYDDAESHSGRLRTFAFLVMAEACNKMVDDMPYSEIVKAAIEEEREACAEACERAVGSASMYQDVDAANSAYRIKNYCQKLIRARGQG